MTSPPPAPVAIGMGRGNAAVTVLMLAFLGVVVAVSAVSAVGSSGSARAFGILLAIVFAIPLVMLLARLPRFLAPRSIVFDAAGLYLCQGSRREGISWSLIAAMAIGYEYPQGNRDQLPLTPDGLKDVLVDRTSGAVIEGLQLSDRRRFALEIYPARPDAVNYTPKLRPYWIQQVPAAPGLPPVAWRIMLPPVTAIADQVGRGAHALAPQRWLGFVQRPWSGRA